MKNLSCYKQKNGYFVRYELFELYGFLIDNFDYGTNGVSSTNSYFDEQKTLLKNLIHDNITQKNKVNSCLNTIKQIEKLQNIYSKYGCVFDIPIYTKASKIDIFGVLNIISEKFTFLLCKCYYWLKFTPLNLRDDKVEKKDILYNNKLMNDIIRKFKNR